MKHLLLMTILTAFMSNYAIASNKNQVSGKGEVDTDCPWSKQDERNSDNSAKIKAIAKVNSKKSKNASNQ